MATTEDKTSSNDKVNERPGYVNSPSFATSSSRAPTAGQCVWINGQTVRLCCVDPSVAEGQVASAKYLGLTDTTTDDKEGAKEVTKKATKVDKSDKVADKKKDSSDVNKTEEPSVSDNKIERVEDLFSKNKPRVSRLSHNSRPKVVRDKQKWFPIPLFDSKSHKKIGEQIGECYVCIRCNKMDKRLGITTSKKAFRRHMRTIHENNWRYVCEEGSCHYTDTRRDNFSRHLWTVHRVVYIEDEKIYN